MCELGEYDAKASQTPFVKLEGLEDSALNEDNRVVSGETTFLTEGGYIVNGSLMVRKGAKIEFRKAKASRSSAKKAGKSKNKKGGRDKEDSRGLMPVTDIRKVLAVRVQANDSSPGSSLSEIGDKIFGTDGDAVNLAERYDSCSFGQLVMQPYDGVTAGGDCQWSRLP
jgi:hypothetical protein